MRYAILSDIHGNWEALQAVLDACRRDAVDSFLCLGDLVGYGANPVECLQKVISLNMTTVAGNHDWAVSGRFDPHFFNLAARTAVFWTRQQLSYEYLKYLNDLPLVFRNDDLILAHGTLNHPGKFDYLVDLLQAQDTFYLMDRDICFVGHTHIPQLLRLEQGKAVYVPGVKGMLQKGRKYLVNPGSVGQPRDGNPDAAYCLFSTDDRTIEIKRAPYDVRTAQAKILKAGLPEFLARRLAVGQ